MSNDIIFVRTSANGHLSFEIGDATANSEHSIRNTSSCNNAEDFELRTTYHKKHEQRLEW